VATINTWNGGTEGISDYEASKESLLKMIKKPGLKASTSSTPKYEGPKIVGPAPVLEVIPPMPTFQLAKNKYFIFSSATSEYIPLPIKFGELKGNFLEILESPDTLSAGYILHNKQILLISRKELLKRRINVNRSSSSHGNSTTSTTSTATTIGHVDAGGTSNPDKQRAESETGALIDSAANILWEEQVGALLSTEGAEEEWVVMEDSSQS